MNLTPEQTIIIGFIAPILVQAIKLIFAWLHKPIDRKWITVFLFAVSLLITYLFARPALPAWPVYVEDPGIYAGMIVQFLMTSVGLISAIVGFAVIIYNLLLQKVFDALDVGANRVAKLSGAMDYPNDLKED